MMNFMVFITPDLNADAWPQRTVQGMLACLGLVTIVLANKEPGTRLRGFTEYFDLSALERALAMLSNTPLYELGTFIK